MRLFNIKKNGKLEAVVISHVDDFCVGSSKQFFEELVEKISQNMKISKIEMEKFKGKERTERHKTLLPSLLSP